MSCREQQHSQKALFSFNVDFPYPHELTISVFKLYCDGEEFVGRRRTNHIEPLQEPLVVDFVEAFSDTFRVVVQVPSMSRSVTHTDPIADFTIKSINVLIHGESQIFKFQNAEHGFAIFVRAELLPQIEQQISFELGARNLELINKKDKCDAYYIIRRADDWQRCILMSEVVQSWNPEWKKRSVSLWNMCSGNLNMPLLIQIWDRKSDLSNELIGECQMTTQEILDEMNEIPLTNSKQKKKDHMVGELYFRRAKLINNCLIPGTVESPGIRFKLILGVDFQSSSGRHSKSATSLHRSNNDPMISGLKCIQILEAVRAAWSRFDNSDQLTSAFVCGLKDSKDKKRLVFGLDPEGKSDFENLDQIFEAYRRRVALDEKPSKKDNSLTFIDVMVKQIQEEQQNQQNQSHHTFNVLVLVSSSWRPEVKLIHVLSEASKLPISIAITGYCSNPYQDGNSNSRTTNLLSDHSMKQPLLKNNIFSISGREITQQHIQQEIFSRVQNHLLEHLIYYDLC